MLRRARWGLAVALLGLVAGSATNVRAAEEKFSGQLSADEFAAAGLNKLTAEELARLDALVRAHRNGEIDQVRVETAAKVREETTAKVRAETVAQVKAELAAAPAGEPKAKEEGSLLHRLRVKLTPGTDIEYATVETQLVGSFRGYKPGTILTLSNGQRWRVVDGEYWSPASEANKPRKVVIQAGAFGAFFLQIEGIGRPKVKIVSNPQ